MKTECGVYLAVHILDVCSKGIRDLIDREDSRELGPKIVLQTGHHLIGRRRNTLTRIGRGHQYTHSLDIHSNSNDALASTRDGLATTGHINEKSTHISNQTVSSEENMTIDRNT